MSPNITVSDVLAGATASMVSEHHDVVGALMALLSGTVEVMPADAAAVVVENETGALELLAASNHRASDLEMYQVLADEGPCIDTVRAGVATTASGAKDLAARWPVTGPAVLASGYTFVTTAPLRWHGRCFGALNVFGAEAPPDGGILDCQPLADAATMLILSTRLAEGDLTTGLRTALTGRAVVERAKGALAHARSLAMPEAFDALLRLATEERLPLGNAAELVMERARSGDLR